MAYDLRFALRMIRAHGWFSAAVVVTLALGIGLNTMVFTIVNAALLKPVPVPGGARLVAVAGRDLANRNGNTRLSYADLLDYRAQLHTLDALEGAADLEGVLGEPGNPPQTYHLERATTGIFSMLHIHPILGRDFQPSDAEPGAPQVLMLGYTVWKQRYNSAPSVIGRQVRINEKAATIIGVMPKGFAFPTVVDLWTPLIATSDQLKRDNRDLQAFALLKPGVSRTTAQAELDAVAHRLAAQYSDTNKNTSALVLSFHERYNGGNIKMVFLLMLASVGFVLLIACANVANMMLSRALGRQREMSIRAALGASRWRITRQFLVESVLLSVLGGLAGLALAVAGVHWFNLATSNVGRPYWVQFTMDYSVFGYFAALCILSGLVFGLAPALRSSRPDLQPMLQEGGRTLGRHRGGTFTAILVVFQFALTLVLLTGAGIFAPSLIRSFDSNRSVPADQLMTANIDFPSDRYKDTGSIQRFYNQLLPRIQAIPGVSHVAIVSNPPGLGSADSNIELEHASVNDPAHRPPISFVVSSPGYLATVGVPLLLGRDFNPVDGTAHHEAAIFTVDSARDFWPGQSAIGKRFRFYNDKNQPDPWITVVGVCANVVQDLNNNHPRPLFFLTFRQEGWNGMALVVHATSNPIPAVRAAVQKIDQDLPLRDVFILTAAVEHQLWYLHLFSKIFAGFAFIALIMASVGIYAVLAQSTSRRTQEIGVRIALGASVASILLLVMRRGFWQIGAGLALGLAAAIPAARLMANLPIGVSPTDPDVFFAVAGVLAIVGIAACWLPARRAAALDPVAAIRCE
ncbi:MAG: ABC transporter permease [Acidobacteriaceae bacterium]